MRTAIGVPLVATGDPGSQRSRLLGAFAPGAEESAVFDTLGPGEAATARFELVSELTGKHALKDLVIEHPPIEEIVAKLYHQADAGRCC